MPNNDKIPLRVLIIEDRSEDAELIVQELGQAGFEVKARRVEDEDGLKAQLDETVDVILAEYALPRYNALHALSFLRESGRDIPFIIVTGALSDEDAVECIQRGAADYLHKDRLARLGAAVQGALSQKRACAEHRAAEQVLLAGEKKYKALFNQIRDPVFLVEVAADGRLGSVLEANNAACLRLGYSRAALLRLTLPDINAPEYARILKLIAGKIRTDANISFATELLARNGQRIPVELLLSQIDLNGKKIITIAYDVSEQRKAEELSHQIHETEKRMLGMELHDNVGQYLTAIALKSKFLENQLKSKKLTEAALGAELSRLVNEASAQVRQVARTLFPVELERLGLEAALRNLLAFMEAQFEVNCKLDYQLPSDAVNIMVATHLHRIVQETMHNAVKHNKARRLSVSLTGAPDQIVLVVRDDGLPPSVHPESSQGIGCDIVKYRCKILNASLTQRAAKTGGNEMILELPPPPPHTHENTPKILDWK